MTSVAIVGAGFSGAATAIEFLRNALPGDTLFIINRSGEMAQGLAYGTNSPHHLLNVPAGNMSAITDDPDSFVNYCKNIDSTIKSSSFAHRSLYGKYLASTLKDAEVRSLGSCIRIIDEAVKIQHDDHASTIFLRNSPPLVADHIVLAFGNFPPSTPTSFSSLLNDPSYIADPWKASPVANAKNQSEILIIGCGLTAIDAILKIKQDLPAANFILVSRRGLQSQPHREHLPTERYSGDVVDKALAPPHTALNYLRVIRKEIATDPENWPDVIAALRPVTPRLWQSLPESERRSFIRHLQPYWDSHRHRVAPESYQKFSKGQKDGSIKLIKGRVVSAMRKDEQIQVAIRNRGDKHVTKRAFDWIINCTGPSTKLSDIKTLLIQDLIEQGIIKEDQHNLGLITQGTLVIDSKGKKLHWISYIGPMLKANFWEATAVPELRKHAQDLISRINSKAI